MAVVMSDIRKSLKATLKIIFLFAINQGLVKSHLCKYFGRNTSNTANTMSKNFRDSQDCYQEFKNKDMKIGSCSQSKMRPSRKSGANDSVLISTSVIMT